MSILTYNMIVGALSLAVLYGLSLMSQVKTAVRGNFICSVAMALAIIATIIKDGSMTSQAVWISILIGSGIGLYLSNKVKMIQMPQLVALLNGLGGGSAAIVGMLVLVDNDVSTLSLVVRISASLALVTGMMTIAGALVAAGKLHQVLPQKPVILHYHNLLINLLIALMLLSTLAMSFAPAYWPSVSITIMTLSGMFFGIVFAIRVGGADMPITISLLNSLAGVSAAIAGFSINDPMLVSIGAIVGAAGLLLTRIMCRAMNRKLQHILLGSSAVSNKKIQSTPQSEVSTGNNNADLASLCQQAQNIIIVPGYGMALAQAQHKVKELADLFEANGANVSYAIHPVAGRMPGHMNVLLAEAGINYEQLLEMEQANPLFVDADLVLVVGANDVVNPAAMEAEGTPIYGMPILRVDEARNIVICNYDTKPGYAGVNNPLYQRETVNLLLGDACQTIDTLIQAVKNGSQQPTTVQSADEKLNQQLTKARNVIIVPGYGMALAQAQHKVKELADLFEANDANVSYAIHPVAGRMPGHMNVLLAEAGINYEQLLEMDQANPLFADADLVIVIGANDVVNPAAMQAEGTPIYGMPILRVDEAKNIIICNYDTKPGYAGVDNPLYQRSDITLLLGDAAQTVNSLIQNFKQQPAVTKQNQADASQTPLQQQLNNARNVIIVPGYGMALAQAQHKVKELADLFEANGANVSYAIHPVAGRMPGHMNVLLAEAGINYEQLLEMEQANPLFVDADLVLVVGANDVVNPAAMEAEGTPIYGMPILRVDEARNIVICNYDTKPGYAGVNNPLYQRETVNLLLGDACQTIDTLIQAVKNGSQQPTAVQSADEKLNQQLTKARNVIIVPGYGMALAQAQHKVKELADLFEANGANVSYAIHPVAGRMPGHMNVLLAEAGINYEQLLEMDQANPLFADADLVIVIGANDVVNPAAMQAEGTPIYGMPILRVDEAKNIIICNYDTKPGYAGVDNPLYQRRDIHLLLGDAAEKLQSLVCSFSA